MSNEQQKKIVSGIGSMKVSELQELVRALERMIGIPPQPRYVVKRRDPPPPPAPTERDVVLVGFPDDRKLAVIRVVRQLKDLGLREARDLCMDLPSVIGEQLDPAAAQTMAAALRDAGAEVAMK